VLVPVAGQRGLTRSSLFANRATAAVAIDVVTGAVSLGGRRLAVDPVAEVPLSRRYLLR
jgi:urease alpha subunit